MADAGFFRGTNLEQNARFYNNEKKLLKRLKYPPNIGTKVDMSKVSLDTIKPWITQRVTQLLGVEDDIVVEFVFNLLEKKQFPDPRELQLNLTGFLHGNGARIFMQELWELLTSAQESIGGIPTKFLEQKKEEIRQKKDSDLTQTTFADFCPVFTYRQDSARQKAYPQLSPSVQLPPASYLPPNPSPGIPPQPRSPYPIGSPLSRMAVTEQTHLIKMDFQNTPALQQFLVANVHPTGRELGTGAYGCVVEVEIPGATCAAKRIHEILLRTSSADAVKNISDRFVQECRLLSSLHHPHIVQFLGVCFLPGSRLPMLVMERLMMSLGDLLDNNPNISLPIKRSILHDIARGLAYLHSHVPPIFHRDLTAKNVLLNTAMVAKLADLGVARIVDIHPGQLAATMIQVPGTAVYMPPEALEPNARYDSTIDVFSFGNLALYTLTQTFPELKAATYVNSEGNVVARTEVERRMNYIDQIQQQLGHHHPMVLMIERCLHNNPQDRPTVNHILQELAGVMAQIPDRYGQMSRLEMERILVEREEEVVLLQQQLQHQLQQIQSKDRVLQSRYRELQLQDLKLELKDSLIKQLPPAFVTRFTAEELPPHIKKHIQEDCQEWEENLFKFHLFCEHPSSRNLSKKTLEVHKNQTLGEATERAYRVLELQECGVQLEQCQLVRYNEHTGTLGKPFDGPKDTPLGEVVGGPPSCLSFDLLVKIQYG